VNIKKLFLAGLFAIFFILPGSIRAQEPDPTRNTWLAMWKTLNTNEKREVVKTILEELESIVSDSGLVRVRERFSKYPHIGIGIQYRTMVADVMSARRVRLDVIIERVAKRSSAHLVGIKSGDRIVAVNGRLICETDGAVILDETEPDSLQETKRTLAFSCQRNAFQLLGERTDSATIEVERGGSRLIFATPKDTVGAELAAAADNHYPDWQERLRVAADSLASLRASTPDKNSDESTLDNFFNRLLFVVVTVQSVQQEAEELEGSFFVEK